MRSLRTRLASNPRLLQDLAVGAGFGAVALLVGLVTHNAPDAPAKASVPRERIVTRIIRPTPEPRTIVRYESPCKGAVLHLQPRLFVWVCPDGTAYSARYDR